MAQDSLESFSRTLAQSPPGSSSFVEDETSPTVEDLQLPTPLWAKHLDPKDKARRLRRVRDCLDPEEAGQLSEVERIIHAWSTATIGESNTYPRPELIAPGHRLWEEFSLQIFKLFDADSFEVVAAVLDYWNNRKSEHST